MQEPKEQAEETKEIDIDAEMHEWQETRDEEFIRMFENCI